MRPLFPVVLAAVVLLGGCKQNDPIEAPPSSGAGVSAGDSGQLPVELRNDAYEYYGLANTKPIELEMDSTYGGKKTGARVTKLVKVEDGKATFQIEHTGGLDQLGITTYVLTKKGLYAEKISIGTFSPGHRVEVPAALTPGVKWGGPITLKLNNGTTIKTNLIYRVVGPDKIKTKAGMFDAILVKATSNGTRGAENATETMSIWLAKGLGAVKIQMKQTVGKNSGTTSIEATKVTQ